MKGEKVIEKVGLGNRLSSYWLILYVIIILLLIDKKKYHWN